MSETENKVSSQTASQMMRRLKDNVIVFEGLALQYDGLEDVKVILEEAVSHNKEIIQRAEGELSGSPLSRG
ncbi:MAG: hypothetical protein ACYTE8_10750 [Planctomycetota bacterium]|jgi:hypothetical protein